MTYRAIAIQNGIKPVTFYARVRRGWTPEQAATTPARAYFYEWNPT
jgi:hypothetical protein